MVLQQTEKDASKGQLDLSERLKHVNRNADKDGRQKLRRLFTSEKQMDSTVPREGFTMRRHAPKPQVRTEQWPVQINIQDAKNKQKRRGKNWHATTLDCVQ